ncbi:MAG TPA: ABC transporter ATP-binding protein [Streptosporangiaceae bacterium]
MRRRTAAVLWDALRREPRQVVRVACWSVVEAAPAFVIGHAIARAIEDGFAAGRPWTGLGYLAVLGGVWLVAAAGARQVVLAVAGIVEPFRDRLLTRVVGGALRRATSTGTRAAAPHGGEREHAAVARSTLQVELARDAFAAVITVVRTFVFTVVSVVLGMLTLFPKALVPVLPPFAVGLGIFAASLPVLARRQREFILRDERTVEAVTTVVGGLRDIVACGAEDRVAAAADRQVTGQAAAGVDLAKVSAVRTLALAIGAWLPVVTILAATPWLVRGGAGPGVVIGALAYVTQSLSPALHGLVQGLGASGVQLMVSLDRILEQEDPEREAARDGEPDGTPVGAAPPAPRPRLRNGPAAGGGTEIEVRGVTFAYGPHAEPVIADLDLAVPPGDHLAVVGPSGIGKSTLAALITGLLVPGRGEILLDGVPADQVAPCARVLIPQEAYVFRGTLLDNLAYLHRAGPAGDPPRAAVDAAVDAVGMEALVLRVGGYESEIDPGAMSAGERQLIALARAHLAAARPRRPGPAGPIGPPGLTILDEATCHLDPAAEARAELAFARLPRTLIVIAHRISSAVRARRVLLLDGTRVVTGTHEELIRAAPLYADLVGHWQPPDRDHVQEFVP